MKKLSKKKIILIGVVVLVVFLTWFLNREEEIPGKLVNDVDKGWVTYTNEAYGFQLEFPNTWQLFEDFSTGSPMINVYKRVPGVNPPYDHFSNVPHVSVYPNGLPKEGVVGDYEDITEDQKYVGEKVTQFNEYTLEDGSVWARFITFKNPPETWQDWGYIWTRGEVRDYQEICFDGEEEVSIYECNTFNGDYIRRSGTISTAIDDIQIEILDSFRFLK